MRLRTLTVKRRLFNFAIWLSLILTLALSALYVRAFVSRDELHTSIFRHDCLVATFPHHLHVILAQKAAAQGYPTSLTRGLTKYPPRPKYLQPRVSDTGLYWEVSVPLWLPLLFAAALPLWVAGRTFTRRRRRDAGLCPACGYDLRASPSRCPECGRVQETPHRQCGGPPRREPHTRMNSRSGRVGR
jgi:hypothetical protein